MDFSHGNTLRSNNGQKASRALDYWKVIRTLQKKWAIASFSVHMCYSNEVKILFMQVNMINAGPNLKFFKAAAVDTWWSLKMLQEIFWKKNGKQYFKLLKDGRNAGVCDVLNPWVQIWYLSFEAGSGDPLEIWSQSYWRLLGRILTSHLLGRWFEKPLRGYKWNILQRTQCYHDISNINVTLRQLDVPLTDV